MLMIRLSRIGRKKHPHYRLVIAEKARDTYGRALEILGHYHPLQESDKDKLVLNKERIEHWIKEGAQMSNTVHNLFIEAGILKDDKKRTIGSYKSKKEAPPEQPKAQPTPAAVTPSEQPKEKKEEVATEAPVEQKKEDVSAEADVKAVAPAEETK